MSSWSSYPQQQLLQENWRGFLTEQVVIDRHVKILMESLQEVEDDLEQGRDPKIEDVSIIDEGEIQKYFNEKGYSLNSYCSDDLRRDRRGSQRTYPED